MKLSEKHPWLTWRNAHHVAAVCIVAGMVVLAVNFAIVAMGARSTADIIDQLSFPFSIPVGVGSSEVPTPPTSPAPPTAPGSPQVP